jgi:hypothetical protein
VPLASMATKRSPREAASRKPSIRPWLSHEYIWVADVSPPIMISTLGMGVGPCLQRRSRAPRAPLTRPPAHRDGPAIWSRKHGPQGTNPGPWAAEATQVSGQKRQRFGPESFVVTFGPYAVLAVADVVLAINFVLELRHRLLNRIVGRAR